MMAVLDSELFKLRTTRTFVGICLAAVLITSVICGLITALADFGPGDQPVEDILELVFFIWPFAFVVGALATTTEFRHGTVTPSLLAVPNRLQLLAAKLVAHLIAGFVLGVVSFLLPMVMMVLILGLRSVDTGLDAGTFFDLLSRSALVAALYAAIGVGFGSIMRNQVAAIMIGLAWVVMVEPAVSAIPGMDFLESYGLQGLASATSGIEFVDSDQWLSPVPAGLLLALYAVVLLAGGAALMRGRDIESKT